MSHFVPAYEIVQADGVSPRRTAFVLHGILGSAQNWRMYARKLAAGLPAWRFVLVDLRNHGESRGAPPPHTLAACAADLVALAETLGAAPEAVIGHSFGGKVALVYARDHGAHTGLAQAWALDSTPGAAADRTQAEANSDVVAVIAALRQLELPIAGRRELVELLRERGFSDLLARWMTTNLRRADDDQGFVWAFDLDGVDALLDDYLREDLLPFLEARAAAHDAPRVHLLRAERSTRWSAPTLDHLAALDARGGAFSFHTLADADHWVHVDNPDGLRDLLTAHLR